VSPASRGAGSAFGLLLVGLASVLLVPLGGAATQRTLLPGPPGPESAWTARLVAPVSVLSAPVSGRLLDRQSDFGSWSGGPVSLLVLRARMASDGQLWLRVLLPVRPNGTSGWIPAGSAELGTTGWRIAISTERRTVAVFDDGTLLRTFRAVVGAPRTPTPHGLFAVYERVPLSDANGFFGPWALHLTALSDALATFDGGPGRIAIHGRGGTSLRDPLGTARSHGCIRIDNSAIRYLAAHVPDGAPVLID
jgi:lipoprotein-anchoring transpeptidase ErfK/SrfK